MLLDDVAWQDQLFMGTWRPGGGGSQDVVSPSTGEVLGRVGIASPADVDTAAGIAVGAQRRWAARPYDERAAVLRRAGQLWEEHLGEISSWLMTEAGSIAAKAAFEITTAAQECYEAAALAGAPYGELLRSHEPRLSMARRLPVGVVGVIAPFNVPIILSIRAVAPALALGNAVVLKPDPRTAVSGGVALARIFEAAGLPEGLLCVLPGGVGVGEAVVAHPSIRVIAFTGSTAAGRRVGALAATHLKRVHLELGGNSALVVMDDVDASTASSVGAWGSFFHQGQVCMATSRHLVHEKVAEEYVARLSARADALVVGDPAVEQVDLGPLIDVGQRDAVHAIVADSVAGGAKLTAGGTFSGLFYRPTVLADVSSTAPAFTREIFGPVAPVTTFSSLEEVISLASATEYGLSLGILTHDVMLGMQIADAVPSGLVHINDQTVNDEAVAPFGGVLASGTGSRHGGAQANVEAFTETQWLTLRSTPPAYPW